MKRRKTITLGRYVIVTFVKDRPFLGIIKGIRRTGSGISYDIELQLDKQEDGSFDYTMVEKVEARYVSLA